MSTIVGLTFEEVQREIQVQEEVQEEKKTGTKRGGVNANK